MNVAVLIPFAGDCPYRKVAFDWVRGRYISAGFDVVIGNGDADRWCKADAVHDALTRTTAELLVVADADVWSDELPQAIAAVEAGAKWAIPHRQVWRLTKDSTPTFMADPGLHPGTEETHTPMLGGGLVVIARDRYLDTPLDPRFVGWGGEDQAWGLALRTLHGPPEQIRGRLYHLWHPPQQRRSRVRGSVENTALVARYGERQDDPAGMRALIEEAKCHSLTSSPSP